MPDPAFAVALFSRVFDTEPDRHQWSLAELTARLQQFEVRLDLARRVARELEWIDAAWAAWQAGELRGGYHWSRISRAAREATQWGKDPEEAAARTYRTMRNAAPKRAKGEMPTWSPTLYPEGKPKRGNDQVIHLSCLCLDYDGGASVDSARGTWERWFHVVHSTWSHTNANPKFRLVLPLSRPVPTTDWHRVWGWAERLAGFSIDPQSRDPSRMYLLPAVPAHDAPRVAYAHHGPLLDLEAEGALPVDGVASVSAPSIDSDAPFVVALLRALDAVLQGTLPTETRAELADLVAMHRQAALTDDELRAEIVSMFR